MGNDSSRVLEELLDLSLSGGPISLPVQINGLSYVLEGQQSELIGSYEIFLKIPDEEWQKALPGVLKMRREDVQADNDYKYTLLRDLGEGKVGKISFSKKLEMVTVIEL